MYSLRGSIGHIIMKLFGLFPLKNKIVFSSFDGKNFGDNPKAIYDEIHNNGFCDLNTELVWFMYDTSVRIPGAKVVKAYSIKALYHQATAKVWIFNSRQRAWMMKRKGQLYIQTWHGGIAMKKIEKDAMDKLPGHYIEEAKHDSSMADYFISASSWNTDNYRRAFWYNGEILEIGLPRADVFYNSHTEIKKRVYESLDIPRNVKTVLYAPTFRDNGSLDSYTINYEQLIGELEKKWPSEWRIIIRFHPNVQVPFNYEGHRQTLIDGSRYPDTNELIIASDLLITDYSSCMFDALEIGHKTILYAADYDTYLKERGTYFYYNELPFPVAKNNEELSACISAFDEDKYSEKGQAFVEWCGIKNDGKASQRIVEIIKKAIQ